MVQTGPKTQLGGENGGLTREAYQPGMAAEGKRRTEDADQLTDNDGDDELRQIFSCSFQYEIL